MARNYGEDVICCFTGHRDLPWDRLEELSKLMDRVLGSLINQGVRHFRAGGALGFDTLAALKVLDLREQYPDVRLHLYLPCRDQDAGWKERDRQIYRGILERADEILYVREHYTRGCMLERNRAMANGATICVAFCAKNTGGSAYTLRYAKEKGVGTINLAELLRTDLQKI